MTKTMKIKDRTHERLNVYKSMTRIYTFDEAINLLLDKNANR